jgi:hypothetical protein
VVCESESESENESECAHTLKHTHKEITHSNEPVDDTHSISPSIKKRGKNRGKKNLLLVETPID